MRSQKKPVLTISIAVVNVLVFFYLSMGGRTEDALYMAENGAMFVPYFIEKEEYYRIFTSMFLHFGFDHLFSNMVTLCVVGSYVEPLVGKWRFAIIYLVSGLGGNILSVMAELQSGEFAVSAGASGAIFGITGALLGLTLLNHGQVAGITRQSVLLIIVLNLYNGFVNEGIDNYAHIGGLVCGFLITLLLCFQRYTKRRSDTNL